MSEAELFVFNHAKTLAVSSASIRQITVENPFPSIVRSLHKIGLLRTRAGPKNRKAYDADNSSRGCGGDNADGGRR